MEKDIPNHTAHIWHADLNKSADEIAQFLTLLSADEKQRAARFIFDKDRNHFIVARGILRETLSRYLEVTPQEIVFSYT